MASQADGGALDPAPFRVEETARGPVTAIAVTGELDLSTVPQLDEQLGKAGAESRIILDLAGCEFIDSTGIGLIVRCWRRHDEAGGALALCGMSDQVHRLLQITGLESSIATYRDCDEALAHLTA